MANKFYNAGVGKVFCFKTMDKFKKINNNKRSPVATFDSDNPGSNPAQAYSFSAHVA